MAPDADLHSVGHASFDWIVDSVAKLAVKKARVAERKQAQLHWVGLLSGANASDAKRRAVPMKKPVAKSASARKSAAKPVSSKSRYDGK